MCSSSPVCVSKVNVLHGCPFCINESPVNIDLSSGMTLHVHGTLDRWQERKQMWVCGKWGVLPAESVQGGSVSQGLNLHSPEGPLMFMRSSRTLPAWAGIPASLCTASLVVPLKPSFLLLDSEYHRGL